MLLPEGEPVEPAAPQPGGDGGSGLRALILPIRHAGRNRATPSALVPGFRRHLAIG